MYMVCRVPSRSPIITPLSVVTNSRSPAVVIDRGVASNVMSLTACFWES